MGRINAQNTMKISIITPSFNQAPYLERTLASIHDQQGDFELEHIVFDGASTDGSRDILEGWKDRLWYVSQPDRGQSHALNKGFAKATGDLVGWLNSDDLYLPGTLDVVASYFRAHPGKDWVTGRCRIIDPYDREIRRAITLYKNLLLAHYGYKKLLVENFISQPSTFFRKSLLNKVGGLDEQNHYSMDYDLWLRFGRLSEPGIIDAQLGAIRIHPTAKTGSSVDDSLKTATEVSQKYARLEGVPFLGKINYWFYYKRTKLIYNLMALLAGESGKR